MTNATKAQIIVLVNSVLALVVVFGVPLSNEQAGAIDFFANAVLGLYVALTYKDSPKRVPELDPEEVPEDTGHVW